MSLKEDRSVKILSRKIANFRRKQEGTEIRLKETEKEADIIAAEFDLPMFKPLDKQEYRQLIKYDTWEHDDKPETWVKRCQEIGRAHV